MTAPTPTPTGAPKCDAARAIPTLAARLRHYKTCTDPRCVERLKAVRHVGRLIMKCVKRVPE